MHDFSLESTVTKPRNFQKKFEIFVNRFEVFWFFLQEVWINYDH